MFVFTVGTAGSRNFFTCVKIFNCINFFIAIVVVSVALAVPLASWGTTAATRVPRLQIGECPREWTRGQHRIKKVPRTNSALGEGKLLFQTGAGGARLAFSGKST